MQLEGFPGVMAIGGRPVEFTAVLTNPTATDYPSVAPVLEVGGGPCNCVDGSLQVLDPATGAWVSVTLATGEGSSPASFASAGTSLPAHASRTIHYRLATSARNPAKDVFAMLYAVDTASHRALAVSSTPSHLG